MWRDVKLLLRSLIRDEEFLENMPYSLKNELISIKDPIPIRIKSMVMDYIQEYNFRRVLVIENNEDLKVNHWKERMASRNCLLRYPENTVMNLHWILLENTLNLNQ